MAGKIFINYRRGDDPNAAGRLFDRLQEAFAPEQLFMDVDNIEPGLDFVKVLKQQVARCDVLIAVIGKDWVDARDETGARRLDNANDFVRVEIESALARDKRVIAVLVGAVQMPRADQLPGSLQPLATRHAVRLTHERFRAEAQALIGALHRALKSTEEARIEQAQAAAERQRVEEEARAKAAAEAERERIAALEAKGGEDERRKREAGEERGRNEEGEAKKREEGKRGKRQLTKSGCGV